MLIYLEPLTLTEGDFPQLSRTTAFLFFLQYAA